MPIDVNAFLSAQQNSSSPELSQEWTVLEEYYNKRLWHQLTMKLLEFVKLPQLQNEDIMLKLYMNFIVDFENKINLLSLVEIIYIVAKQIKDHDKCVDFVTKVKEKVKARTEAVVLCNIIIGHLKLTKREMEGVKKILEETEELIDSLEGITSVHGRYYQLCSDYNQVIGNHAQYYREALRYLGCTELTDISAEEQVSRAFTLCLAALLGEGVYNFGELLAHPILDSLRGSDKQWVIDLLYAFNSGNIDRFEEMKSSWKTQPDLAARELALRQKISLLCLMEMTFKRPGNHRILKFSDIASETKLPVEEVELLVMKALSLDLVRGAIDQVDKKVHMYWVQPRVLDRNQIGGMKERLEHWCQDVQSMEILLENKAHDILT
ncbi:26S proteasome non-ATPase regulatory subunit 13-like [Limulus polyphemus]|uniref:26S proteasome non-ATPase regulatory subunit 13 n=1 Tax=Limulus polyphemus TaxID=6850 RepID=A0ABM1BNW0_LIMPO|nr:26S proteasome non-ATPase regulatory subunit 13-like [Limulus polyphemus]